MAIFNCYVSSPEGNKRMIGEQIITCQELLWVCVCKHPTCGRNSGQQSMSPSHLTQVNFLRSKIELQKSFLKWFFMMKFMICFLPENSLCFLMFFFIKCFSFFDFALWFLMIFWMIFECFFENDVFFMKFYFLKWNKHDFFWENMIALMFFKNFLCFMIFS